MSEDLTAEEIAAMVARDMPLVQGILDAARIRAQEGIGEYLPWLWVCSECGAVWLAASDFDMAPGTECPDEPTAHAGACFSFELYPDDMDQPLEAALHHIPPDGVFDGLYLWAYDADWRSPLRNLPVR